MKKEMCDNPNNDTRQQVRYNDKNRKTKKRVEIKDEKKKKKKTVFDSVHRYSIIHRCILATPALKVIEDFKSVIQEGPTSDICRKFEF